MFFGMEGPLPQCCQVLLDVLQSSAAKHCAPSMRPCSWVPKTCCVRGSWHIPLHLRWWPGDSACNLCCLQKKCAPRVGFGNPPAPSRYQGWPPTVPRCAKYSSPEPRRCCGTRYGAAASRTCGGSGGTFRE